MGEEKRHEMMQNLFGDQSEEEIDSEQESNPEAFYASDEAEEEMGNVSDVEDDGKTETHADEDAGSVGNMHGERLGVGESEDEKEEPTQGVDIDNEEEESDAKYSDTSEKEEYGEREATSRRHDIVESGSEASMEEHYSNHEDVEINASMSPRSLVQEEAHNSQAAEEIRDVFGDSEEEDEMEYAVQDDVQSNLSRDQMDEDEGFEKNLGPEDILADGDVHYELDEEISDAKRKEKLFSPPLDIELPFCRPPAEPSKMNLMIVSNIMCIDPNPFDPNTYVEEKSFVTDETGSKRRIRLGNNTVRWRTVNKPNGTSAVESNARFVRWSDGSLQLLIGNEILDISVQDAKPDQSHLFRRHNKSLLQSQGRILRKMRCMPSSLTSTSHRLLTALVETRHKKSYKVKNCITDIDPEKAKEEQEKAENQTIKANVLLSRKREKVTRKYPQTVERRFQLSPGFLEGALDEEDEMAYYDSQPSMQRQEDEMEAEAQAERRILNAKKGNREIIHKSSTVKPSKNTVYTSDVEKEESEYDSEEEEAINAPMLDNEEEEVGVEAEEDRYEEEAGVNGVFTEEEEDAVEPPKQQQGKEFGSKKSLEIESDEDSPPRKIPTHRRMAVVFDSDDE